MPQYGMWIAYSGSQKIILMFVLFVIAILLAFFGSKLKSIVMVKSPSMPAFVIISISWLLSGLTFIINVAGIVFYLKFIHIPITSPPDYITYFVSLPSVILTSIIITVLNRKVGLKNAIYSGVVASFTALALFEIPFDLIIFSHTLPIPPNPYLIRSIFFLPLFVVSIITLIFPLFSPVFKLTRFPFYFMSLMFFVFMIWAFFGFAYPLDRLSIFLNGLSKVLAFTTSISLFYPYSNKNRSGEK